MKKKSWQWEIYLRVQQMRMEKDQKNFDSKMSRHRERDRVSRDAVRERKKTERAIEKKE